MALDRNDSRKIDDALAEIRRLAYLVEGRSKQESREPSWWDSVVKSAGALLLGVSLTLGINHEINHSPANHIAQTPITAQQFAPMQVAAYEQLANDVERLANFIKSPTSDQSLTEIRSAIVDDLKAIIKYPCAESVESEAVELLLQFQLDSIQKVASSQQVTSTEHRLKRLASLLKSLCK